MINSVCASDGVCTNTDSLANLPTVIRNDASSYLKQRKGIGKDLVSEPISANVEIEDEEPSCPLYMAMSSIPHSGLGIYAGRDFARGDMVETMPQLVVPLIDYNDGGTILWDYPWTADVFGAKLESEDPRALCTNFGMLANSHLGLFNAKQMSEREVERLVGSTDRASEFGAGATSLYSAASFEAVKDIKKGAELFVDYGTNYFHGREQKWNKVFPAATDFVKADEIVRDFAQKLGDEITEEDEIKWKDIVEQTGEEEDKVRTAYALPDSVQDVKYVAEVGTARFDVPGSLQSLEWLEENAMCLYNLRRGQSGIPHAGHGAFAVKNIKEGTLVSPMPLVPTTREELTLPSSSQLLLNYCFGHPDSSLLFFPYGSTANFINHSENPNALIRWSDSNMSKKEIFSKKLSEVSTGLIMEVVALRDIALGEEVTIHYGPSWSKAWDRHVESWKIEDEIPATNPAFTAKMMTDEHIEESKPYMTVTEMKELSLEYPKCVRTGCYVGSDNTHGKFMNGTFTFTVPQFRDYKFCEIIDRMRKGGMYIYTAKIEGSGEDESLTNIPHMSISFTTDRYCNDMHLANAFRHEIPVPDDMYPVLWKDLLQNDD